VILPWNDPLRLAEKASVLDAVSEGRFVLGLGRGLARMEYEAFGIDMNEARDRFDESARMIVNALETGVIEGTGPYYPQKRTEIRPRPLYSFKDKLYSVAMSPDSITAAAHLGARMMFFIQFALERHLPLVESYRQQYLQRHGTSAPPPHAIDFVVCDRGAKQGKDAIAQGLRDIPLIAMHGVHHQLQSGINDRPRFFRIESFDQCSRTFEIGKERRDSFALAVRSPTRLQRPLLGPNAVGEVRWGITGGRQG
jgi:alkanesulfonate monooxygenase SsuD/methylene tetrahydromethanopterin reductase-like flavin-dependent oxidoreductase (luciferase family)